MQGTRRVQGWWKPGYVDARNRESSGGEVDRRSALMSLLWIGPMSPLGVRELRVVTQRLAGFCELQSTGACRALALVFQQRGEAAPFGQRDLQGLDVAQ